MSNRKLGPNGRNRCLGFTLIEIMVVCGIIVVLAGLSFAVFGKVKASAKNAVCINNLEQLGKAFHMYAGDWDDTMPPDISFDQTKNQSDPNCFVRLMAEVNRYGTTQNTWTCPLDRPEWQTGYTSGPIYAGVYVLPDALHAQYYRQGPPMLSVIPPTAINLSDPVTRSDDDQGNPIFTSPHGVNVCNCLFFDGHVQLSRLDPG